MNGSEYARAMVAREQAEWEAAEAAIAAGLARRTTRSMSTSSVVFSVRLDRGELRAPETRAAALQVKPTVLERNLIRGGLRGPADLAVNDVVDRIVAATVELREMLA